MNLEINSPCVQTHLTMLKGTIDRFSNLGMNCKVICVSLLIALAFTDINPEINPIYKYVMLGLCTFLDWFYLSMENALKRQYDEFIHKLKNLEWDIEEEIFEISPRVNWDDRWKAVTAPSIFIPYLAIFCVMHFIMD